MEFVGKIVKKEFKGIGILSGIVKSYNPSSGLLEIVYEDGDAAELDSTQVASLVECKQGLEEKEKPLFGRKPKKRSRMDKHYEMSGISGNLGQNSVNSSIMDTKFGGHLDDTGNFNANSISDSGFNRSLDMGNGLRENWFGRVETMGDVNRSASSKDEIVQTLEKENKFGENLKDSISANENSEGTDYLKDGFDLNSGLNLNEEVHVNDQCTSHGNSEDSLMRIDSIDLNVDVNNELDVNFDVADLGCLTKKREPKFDLNLEVKVIHGSTVYVDRDAPLGFIKGKEDGVYNGDVEASDSIGVSHANCGQDCSSMEVQPKGGPSETGITIINESRDDSGIPCKEGSSGRKKRKLSDNLKLTSEMVLRRSSRRGSVRNHVTSTIASSVMKDPLSSSGVSTQTKEKMMVSSCVQIEKPDFLPLKLHLPLSSQNLILDDIPILEFFSIYACLRSFSTLLFLSPFELESFVEALKYRSPSTLFDNIHVSILQILRKHLENLSNEGSQTASNCLRNLNWDLLDLITWPIFMAEYLMIHGSGFKPDFSLNHLKLFSSDYYKQPVSIKVEILRLLCDDMIEAEAIRSELNRRSLEAEPDTGFDQNMYTDMYKRRRAVFEASDGSFLAEGNADDTTDWNSDECCLCKMDGSLICCDGCPAAFHSRCVGISNDHLPEGDWYCPECAIDRHKPCMKLQKSLRGADLLGIDPHGRIYFSSCGYLLVSDTSDTESSFKYYQREDLNVIVEVLKSAGTSYCGILKEIYEHLRVPVILNARTSNMDVLNQSFCLDMHMSRQFSDTFTSRAPFKSSGTLCVKNETYKESKMEKKSISGSSDHIDHEVSKVENCLDSVTAMESPCITSDGSAETMPKNPGIDESHLKYGAHDSTIIDLTRKYSFSFAGGHGQSTKTTVKLGTSEVHCDIDYINYYSLARTASLVSEELMCKFPERINLNSGMSEEDIISAQAKAILKKSTKFCWPSFQYLNVDALKEKCGWCLSCKVPSKDRDCLFNTVAGPVWETSNSDFIGLQCKSKCKGHLTDVICHILSLEDQLSGLLLGPWLNSNHTKLWRKSLLKASDMASVKQLLLTLESNLRRLALSVEWLRHVDSVFTMGSASHIVTSSLRTSSKQGFGRKRGRSSDLDSNSASNAASGLGIFWWRGGRLSRKLFNWKVLPCSLACKAARQAGCKKISGILYPENSEYAKRSKYIAWRASVEASTTVEQLALQVRELDSNIKWNDIKNTHPISVLDKDSRKAIRLFKKAIVWRKCTEKEVVKYLIDFGKRKAIPDIVIKHGYPLEESSSKRKKYWLEESYVPLHLLKNFEERRIARNSNGIKPGNILDIGRTKGAHRQRGFSYLFSKAERSEYHQCGHCNKDVPIREAVSCLYCKGFFHKRHVRKSFGAVTAESTYSCHRCQDGGAHVKTGKRQGRGKIQTQKHTKVPTVCRSVKLKGSRKALTSAKQVRSQNNKKALPTVPLRRSARKAKCLALQNKNIGGRRKGKLTKYKKATIEEPQRCTSQRKKRTQVYHSYWLNGLLFSRKKNDERIMLFTEKKQLAFAEHLSVTLDQPRCHLCREAGHTSSLTYVPCQICGEWFHGDAFGLNIENINQLIGFSCHVCRKKAAPICPHMKSNASQLPHVPSNSSIECVEEVSNAVPSLSEIPCN
ncbi:DDT domain-containing protein PTM-like [Quillaja saponaria]|uniref:DDT domain-containing protein PTM-like n=1 Tax=Quillaja saponaria TaxID=32244 RepID=A0AAD7LTH9_QUISA|nr:DDT domain-containing protein PTM-like [Quillaja saponaria]